MKLRIAASGLSIMMALALSGCSAAGSADTGKMPASTVADSGSPSATATPTTDPAYGSQVANSHGNLSKAVGQLAGTSAADGSATVTSRFIVAAIEIDPKCTSSYVEPAKNGHYLELTLNVETTPELASETVPTLSFSEYGWQAFDSTGKRLNDPVGYGYSCLDAADQLPSSIGPGQSVTGKIVLDVADPKGSVALTFGGPSGWEWTY